MAEAKVITTSVGTDLDTLNGQLLRRMINPGARYAVVVPERLVPAALRVPEEVRVLLSIDVYCVGMDDTITKLEHRLRSDPTPLTEVTRHACAAAVGSTA